MSITENGFDPARFKLGKLCPKGHNWNNTGFSLRRLSSGYACVTCANEWMTAKRERIKQEKSDKKLIEHQKWLEKLKNDSAIYTFDPNKYFLGKLCKYNHRFKDSNESLRRQSDSTCLKCKKHNVLILKKQRQSAIDAKSIEIAHKYKFDPFKHYLGGLCVKKHDFKNTKQSLRLISSDRCIQCAANLQKSRLSRLTKEERIAKIIFHQNYYSQNRASILSRVKNYTQTEKGREIADKSRRKYKARKLSAVYIPYTTKDFARKIQFFDNCCAYCGCSSKKFQLDHFIPLAKGGIDAMHNIVPACASCNCSKKASDAKDWYKRQSFFSPERWAKILTSVSQLPQANANCEFDYKVN